MSFNRKQYEDGLAVEKEHKTTYNWVVKYINRTKKMPSSNEFFLHIVEDHLREDPDYYVKLMEAGL